MLVAICLCFICEIGVIGIYLKFMQNIFFFFSTKFLEPDKKKYLEMVKNPQPYGHESFANH